MNFNLLSEENDVLFQDIKEDLAKLLHTKQEVETEVEEQTKKLERTRRDRQVLQEEITGLKKRMDEAGDEYKE